MRGRVVSPPHDKSPHLLTRTLTMTSSTVPSWLPQAFFVALLAISGYFFNNTLNQITAELTLSRIERAQIRNDLSALEIGLRGDRFTRSDWNIERNRIQDEIDDIRSRLTDLEKK